MQDIYTGQFTDSTEGDCELFEITAPAHLAEADTDQFDTEGNELHIWIAVTDEFDPAAYVKVLEAEGWKVVKAADDAMGTWELAR